MFHSSKIFLFSALFIILNIISSMFFTRLDMTENQIYTLSSATEKIINQLPDGIEIKAFVSEKLPPQVITSKTQLVDKLEEYDNIAKGKIKITYVDPINDTEAAKLAESLGIPALDLQTVEQDQVQIQKAYFGLGVFKTKAVTESNESTASDDPYEKKEVLPVIQNMSNFEYELASMLLKVGSTDLPKVAFLSGHGEHTFAMPQYMTAMNNDPRADYDIREGLGRNYDIVTIDQLIPTSDDSSSAKDPLEGVDTLVIPGPEQALSSEEISKIEQFVASGGNAIFLLDSMRIDTQYSFSASSLDPGINSLIKKWGISVEPKIIADASHDMATFNQGYVSYSLPYPFFTKISNLDRTNSITQNLESVTIPWASPLVINSQENINTTILAQSSPLYNLFAEEETTAPAEPAAEGETPKIKMQKVPINLDPQQDFGINRDQKEILPLAVMAQKEDEGKVIIIGDSDFVVFGNENLIFFYNMIDALTLGDDLIQIRSKGVTDRPIKDLSNGEKNSIRWGLIIGLPVLFIAYGFYRRSIRNARKKMY